MKARLIALLSLVLAVALLAGGLPAMAGSGPVAVNVSEVDAGRQVTLNGNNVLVVTLNANPSTGYGWYTDNKLLRRVDESFKADSSLLGAPGKLSVYFQAVSAGNTTLTLSYMRPWENVKPEKTFSINVVAKGPASVAYQAPVAKTPAQPEGSSVNIPVSYNYCPTYCTPIRNQGSCGSCWAFSTVGTMEQHLYYFHGVSTNLAEQYLLRCNASGYSCAGGWYLHNYHYNTYCCGETTSGAVYESAMPYTGTDGSCTGAPHSHPYKLSGWGDLCGNAVCSTTSIKDKIYNYGPVSVAVYVGSAFQAYTSGIFSTSQTGTVNHAIVLTGYNDTYSYFNLRNSWGTSWGESGYMRITYGTSRIGYKTTYVW